MKTKTLFTFIVFILMVSAFGQKPMLELTFTAIDSASYVKLDSIKVMNHTQGGDTVLYWPDTILVLDYQVRIPEVNYERASLQVFQNYPNPVKDQSTITLYIPEKDKVSLLITDIMGRQLINKEQILDNGYHSFRFAPGNGEIFFFTAYWKATSSSIKILSSGNNSRLISSLEYTGSKVSEPKFKKIEASQSFSFSLGDELLYVGFTDTLQSGMLDSPETSETYTFQFAYNIPCPGTPTVTYNGQVYNTIQIFSQCWLKENLNIGIMINGSQNQQNNDTVEKYCYDNISVNCDTYGGLYQWGEIMQYNTMQGTQGICPPGWHIPTDQEWNILEGTVDSQYSVGNPEWYQIGYRGFDVGERLKSSNGWSSYGNGIDLYGFSALPSGRRFIFGYFVNLGEAAYFWSSTKYSSIRSWNHFFAYDRSEAYRRFSDNGYGRSVRCIMD
jgi:uncharacterized protein (TIGR02145 family)